jgi:DNA primase
LENKKDLVLSLLKKVLGEPKKDGDINEYEFNCKSKVCRNDNDKFNLAFNSRNNIFHCWKCRYKGGVNKLIIDYGSQDDINKINTLISNVKTYKKEKKDDFYSDMITCLLPLEYKPLWKKDNSKFYSHALNYATKERGLSLELIKEKKIGYTEDKGKMRYRLIIPSFNNYGQINYYVGRSYYPNFKPNYLGPPKEEVARTEIIFNLKNINFDVPVILVEGAFDMFPLYNAIPMLGKEPAQTIINKLIEHKSRVILCLDEDALCDSIIIFNKLILLGLEVYFVEVKGDIDEYNKKYGKNATIELMKTCSDLNFQELFKEFANQNVNIENQDVINEKEILESWKIFKKNNNYER